MESEYGADIALVAIAQNPAIGALEDRSNTNRGLIVSAADERSVPVIDMYSAFTDAGDPADLLRDDVHPNGDGSRVWADTVAAFFG